MGSLKGNVYRNNPRMAVEMKKNIIAVVENIGEETLAVIMKNFSNFNKLHWMQMDHIFNMCFY
jgi:hypothetical protein